MADFTSVKKPLPRPRRIACVILAGGKGERFGGTLPKQFHTLGSKPLLYYPIMACVGLNDLEMPIIVTAHSQHISRTKKLVRYYFPKNKNILVIPGGKRRSDSCITAIPYLQKIAPHLEIVVVLDGVRPLTTATDIMKMVREFGSEQERIRVAKESITQTLYRSIKGTIAVDRELFFLGQTPNLFTWNLFQKISQYSKKKSTNSRSSIDITEMVPKRTKIAYTPLHKPNIKVTHPEDLITSLYLLQKQKTSSKK